MTEMMSHEVRALIDAASNDMDLPVSRQEKMRERLMQSVLPAAVAAGTVLSAQTSAAVAQSGAASTPLAAASGVAKVTAGLQVATALKVALALLPMTAGVAFWAGRHSNGPDTSPNAVSESNSRAESIEPTTSAAGVQAGPSAEVANAANVPTHGLDRARVAAPTATLRPQAVPAVSWESTPHEELTPPELTLDQLDNEGLAIDGPANAEAESLARLSQASRALGRGDFNAALSEVRTARLQIGGVGAASYAEEFDAIEVASLCSLAHPSARDRLEQFSRQHPRSALRDGLERRCDVED